MSDDNHRLVIGAAPKITIDPSKVRGALMRQAADVVKAVSPKDTKNARQLYIANGWFESYLGGAGSFAPDGVPSWNWGAVMARPGQDFIPHGDHKADGEAFTGHYAKFPTMTLGYQNYRRALPTMAAQAAQRGDAHEMARQMFIAGYYSNVDDAPLGDPEGDKRRVQGYANVLVQTAKLVADALGEPLLVTGGAGASGYVAPTSLDGAQTFGGDTDGASTAEKGLLGAAIAGTLAYGVTKLAKVGEK